MKEIPLQLEGVPENIYGDFWARLGSLLLDAVFLIPFGFITIYLNSLGKYYFFFTAVPNILIGVWYHIYLVKKYGGTPGKLIAGIKIIKLDGSDVTIKEAFMRHSVLLLLTIFGQAIMAFSLLNADADYFDSLSWFKQQTYIVSLSPTMHNINLLLTNMWVYGELIVLLTNPRKRAVHDFIASTVVIKKRHIERVRYVMNSNQ